MAANPSCFIPLLMGISLTVACGGRAPRTEMIPVEPTPVELVESAEEAAEPLIEDRSQFAPSHGMTRFAVESVLGEPRFTGVAKSGRLFGLYEVADRRWRTVEYDSAGLVSLVLPEGPLSPAGARLTTAPEVTP